MIVIDNLMGDFDNPPGRCALIGASLRGRWDEGAGRRLESRPDPARVAVVHPEDDPIQVVRGRRTASSCIERIRLVCCYLSRSPARADQLLDNFHALNSAHHGGSAAGARPRLCEASRGTSRHDACRHDLMFSWRDCLVRAAGPTDTFLAPGRGFTKSARDHPHRDWRRPMILSINSSPLPAAGIKPAGDSRDVDFRRTWLDLDDSLHHQQRHRQCVGRGGNEGAPAPGGSVRPAYLASARPPFLRIARGRTDQPADPVHLSLAEAGIRGFGALCGSPALPPPVLRRPGERPVRPPRDVAPTSGYSTSSWRPTGPGACVEAAAESP